jgi:hypothetical protein
MSGVRAVRRLAVVGQRRFASTMFETKNTIKSRREKFYSDPTAGKKNILKDGVILFLVIKKVAYSCL